MTEQDKCTKCGAPLPASVRGGLCPACLLKRGLETNTVGFTDEDQANAAMRWTPPTVDRLAAIFPELDILELIGRGGMGAVYKAREKQLDRLVALKILPPEIGREPAFAQRFAREAQAMAKLSHSNIVTIYSFGSRPLTAGGQRAAGELAAGGDLYFFIMEYVDGLSVRQLLDAGTVSPKEALAIVPQICDALQYAHDRGIVHRDIKPENILLNRAGQVKIADFGLAKLVGLTAAGAAGTNETGVEAGSRGASGSASLRRDKPGSAAEAGATIGGERVMGTPQYMAPEQIERPSEVDHRADIYSLGVVFYQMLTGELPKGGSGKEFEPPSRKVLIDVRLDEVVLRALQREPARRYQQVSEVRTQVETIVGGDANGPAYQPTQQAGYGWDYRSKRTLWGLPLLHIAEGYDPNTGKPRQAKGVIAWGSSAKGVIAIGGRATGIVAFGGLAVGVIAVGGLSMGLIGFGGLVLAALFAYGGVTVGPFAVGGVAIGLYAQGGFRASIYRLHGNWTMYVSILFYGVFAVLGAMGVWLGMVARRHRPWAGRRPSSSAVDQPPQMESARQAVKAPAIGLAFAAGISLAVLFALIAVIAVFHRIPGADIEPWVLALLIVGLSPNIFVFFAVLRMMDLKGRVPALVAGVLALFLSPGNIIGLPMGIWALVVLNRREVVEAFKASERDKTMGKSRTALLIGFVVALGVVLAGAGAVIHALGQQNVALLKGWASAVDQQKNPAPQVASRQHMVLGSVIERVVNHTGENCLIDLDTGTLVTPPKEAFEGGSKTAIEWTRKNGIDAGGGTQPEVQGLIGFDIIALPVNNKVWSLSGDAGLTADKPNAFAVSTPGNPVYLSARGGVPATYKFQTREGGLGVLQIVGFTDDPKGTRIRYKMLQTAATAAVPHVEISPATTFCPVLDRTINDLDEGKGSEGLKLATGEVVSLPAEFGRMSGQQRSKWIEDQGIDLFVEYANNRWGFMSCGPKLSVINASFDDVSPAALEAALAADSQLEVLTRDSWTFYILPKQSKPPLMLALQTKAGGLGALQIAGFTNDPKGMKIRYKMLQAAASAPHVLKPTPLSAESTMEFRIAPKPSDLDKAELASYMDWLKAGKVGFWWKGGRIAGIAGRMPDHAWLPISSELTSPTSVTGEYKGQEYVLVSDTPGQTMVAGEGKDAWGLAKVYATKDHLNQPAVKFVLDDRGAELFSALTKANINNALAIVVDGKVISAPIIKTVLGKTGMITGKFTAQEVAALVEALRAGMPPATRPTSRPAADDVVGWGELGTDGLRIRLVLDSPDGRTTVLTADNVAAALEVWNTSDKPIKIAEQNTTGGREMIKDEWLIGLRMQVIDPDRRARMFFRADDQDQYWSSVDRFIGVAKEIRAGEKALFKIRLHRLVDSEGTNLLSLRGDHQVQPVLEIRGQGGNLWRGSALGKPVAVRILAERTGTATQPATPGTARPVTRPAADQMVPAPRVRAVRPSEQKFHGLDLAAAPRTTRASDLPDLWEERPKGSRSFEIRKDVRCVYSGLDGAVYHIAEKNCFYIQHDAVGSSAITYFGPFEGDPTKVLKLEAKENAEQRAGADGEDAAAQP